MSAAYRPDPETLELVATMYEQGSTQREIAAVVGVDQTAVSRLMRRHGITTRSGRFVETHGMHATPEYRSWQMMKNRCLNPNFGAYEFYGARGITVCERWRDSFEAFFADMGPRPIGTSLDRYPNCDGNYEPGNARWATFEQQQQNRSDNVLTSDLVAQIRASSESSSAIARRLGISITAAWEAKTGKTWKAGS